MVCVYSFVQNHNITFFSLWQEKNTNPGSLLLSRSGVTAGPCCSWDRTSLAIFYWKLLFEISFRYDALLKIHKGSATRWLHCQNGISLDSSETFGSRYWSFGTVPPIFLHPINRLWNLHSCKPWMQSYVWKLSSLWPKGPSPVSFEKAFSPTGPFNIPWDRSPRLISVTPFNGSLWIFLWTVPPGFYWRICFELWVTPYIGSLDFDLGTVPPFQIVGKSVSSSLHPYDTTCYILCKFTK